MFARQALSALDWEEEEEEERERKSPGSGGGGFGVPRTLRPLSSRLDATALCLGIRICMKRKPLASVAITSFVAAVSEPLHDAAAAKSVPPPFTKF